MYNKYLIFSTLPQHWFSFTPFSIVRVQLSSCCQAQHGYVRGGVIIIKLLHFLPLAHHQAIDSSVCWWFLLPWSWFATFSILLSIPLSGEYTSPIPQSKKFFIRYFALFIFQMLTSSMLPQRKPPIIILTSLSLVSVLIRSYLLKTDICYTRKWQEL